MPWLVVTGTGSWNYRGTPFRAGVHEVDQDVADAAIASRVGSLFVTDFEPEIMRTPDPGSPLTLKDIKVGTNIGVQIARGEAPEEEIADSSGRIFEYPCPYCPKPFASSGARDRHVEFHHELLPT